jgi:hypothetical protein
MVGKAPVELHVQRHEFERKPFEQGRQNQSRHSVGRVRRHDEGRQARDVGEGQDMIEVVVEKVDFLSTPPGGRRFTGVLFCQSPNVL